MFDLVIELSLAWSVGYSISSFAKMSTGENRGHMGRLVQSLETGSNDLTRGCTIMEKAKEQEPQLSNSVISLNLKEPSVMMMLWAERVAGSAIELA